MSKVYSDWFFKKNASSLKFLISGSGRELEPQSHSKLGSGSRMVACQGMGVGWEMDGYGFAWACVALLALGGCTLGRSHCRASAVLWGSWARLNWFSALLFSTSLGLSLHFLFFCEGRRALRGKKKATHPPWHLPCSALDYTHPLANLGQVEPSCKIRSWPFSILAVRRHTVVVIFIRGEKKKKACRKIYSMAGNTTQL